MLTFPLLPHRRCRTLALWTGIVLSIAAGSTANDAVPLPVGSQAPQPTAEQDDAALHDVQLLGSRLGWAVGDRGVVWKTTDGGRTWSYCPVPVSCSLRSVCFLTDQIGWIAGGDVLPYSRLAEGIVLGTTDGGATWTVLAQSGLPFLNTIAFFGLENGIAVGTSSPNCPTGVMATTDGGRTWEPVQGEPSEGWRAAAFLNETTGTLGGLRGQFTSYGGGKVLPRSQSFLGLRGIHAINLQPDGRGWMVGDGALILSTTSGGASWSEPPNMLPTDVREFFNARAVASVGDQVWVAGSPGSAIWHSADAGRTWTSQPCGDPAPLYAMDFSSAMHGCAAGAFGRVLITDDGGRTWTAARGAARRAALLAASSSTSRTPLRMLVKSSAEQGYRAVVAVEARRDIGPDGHLEADADVRLHQAVVSAGGSDTEIGWKLLVAAPGLDARYERLLEQWSRLTDGRLPDVMLQELVAQLRLWRPDVIVLDEGTPEAASAKLLRQAILHAIAQAADPTRYPQQFELMSLQPWQVKRVFVRLPPGETASIRLDPHEILQRAQKTLLMASADVTARLGIENSPEPEFWRQIHPANDEAAANRRDFFSGLALAAGGEARRALPPITELDYEELEHRAQHQRNFAAWRDRALDDPLHAAQVIAQLSDVVADAPRDQAALQLAALGRAYWERSQWQLAEETFIELAERYPEQPVAVDAMVWLLQLWTSQEIGWQRVREVDARSQRVTVDGDAAGAMVSRTEQLLREGGGLDRIRELAKSPDSPLLIQPLPAQVNVGGREGQRGFEAKRWHEQAEVVASELEQRAPAVYQSPEVQFLCAALYRHRQQYQRSDDIVRAFAHSSDPLWQLAALGEQWIVGGAADPPKPLILCKRVASAPVLDGILSDICWQEAHDVPLTAGPQGDASNSSGGGTGDSSGSGSRGHSGALAMLAYDSEYLYFAAIVPHHPDLEISPIQHAGRVHDAETEGHDRVCLLLDVDRDCATYYRLEVDCRGQTQDACWLDERWNPRWYVANDTDSQRWTIEAAIPLSELVPASPGGQTWAVGIVRTIPTVGVESWTHPSGSVPRPPAFGLVRFR